MDASAVLPIAADEQESVKPAATRAARRARAGDRGLDRLILGVAGFIVVVTTGLLLYVVVTQVRTYNVAVMAALKAGTLDHAAVLAYARSTDFSAAKISALFLGFLLIFLGAMFVLRVAETEYSFAMTPAEQRQVTFSTSSPGLAMVTLGVILVIVVLFAKSTIDYHPASAVEVPLYVTEDAAD